MGDNVSGFKNLDELADAHKKIVASRQSRSKALLDAIEGLRALLADQSTITLAATWYAQDTGSTSAICALLRCREHVETIASNARLQVSSEAR